MNLQNLQSMKSNKHIFNFKNQVIIVEYPKKISRFTALKRLLINKNSK